MWLITYTCFLRVSAKLGLGYSTWDTILVRIMKNNLFKNV